MSLADLSDRGPLRPVFSALGGGLRPGEVGVIIAGPGSGKTALLLQFALDRLLRGQGVLHVAGSGTAEAVRDGYDALLDGLGRPLRANERAEAKLAIERHRIIHMARGQATVERVARVAAQLTEVVEFKPTLVVIDGLVGDVAGLQELGRTLGFGVWCTADGGVAGADVVLELVPERSHVALVTRRLRGGPMPTALRLDAATFTARSAEGDDIRPASAADVTVYSGGAAGAEAAFGEIAERFGAREVNYTFSGHVQLRARGAHPLTESELAAGDVSLAYVSRRLRRDYSEGSQIRRVLQSLWHQVSNAQVVFVIGAIQEDGTVTGGTGWSVELARMWNKRLWVFDQDKGVWFRWNNEDWVEGVPVIDGARICGTGTRYLAEAGREAIVGLFTRSFG